MNKLVIEHVEHWLDRKPMTWKDGESSQGMIQKRMSRGTPAEGKSWIPTTSFMIWNSWQKKAAKVGVYWTS